MPRVIVRPATPTPIVFSKVTTEHNDLAVREYVSSLRYHPPVLPNNDNRHFGDPGTA